MTAAAQSAPTGHAADARKWTGEEYIDVLLARQTEFMASHTPHLGAKAFLMPTLDMFVRAGDEDLVDLPPDEPAPKQVPTPRRYRPASYWRARIAALDEQMDATAASVDLGDQAAAGGAGIGRARAVRHGKHADAALSRYTALASRRDHAEWMLHRATEREQRQGVDRGS